MPPIRQSSFAGGQIAPGLFGRSDIPKYSTALRLCRNFLIKPTGAATNRPGTRFVREVKNSAKKVRLIPFIYSDDLSYVLEFGDLYIRFHSNGGTVLNAGIPYEIVSPYLEADLPKLKVAQVGDVMTITHGNYSVYELKRLGHTSWTLTAQTFNAMTPTFSGGTPRAKGPLPDADSTHPAKEWTWKVTALGRDTSGLLWETAPYTVTQVKTLGKQQWDAGTTYALGAEVSVGYSGSWYVSLQNGNLNKPPATEPAWWSGPFSSIPPPAIITTIPAEVVVYPDKPVTIEWAASGLIIDTGFRVVAWRVYRGRGSLFGYVGEATQQKFVDYGAEPDFTQGPPMGRNPFQIYDNEGTLLWTERPSAVCFFEERRMFARTDQRPGFVWASKIGNYDNFDNNFPNVADDAIELELASRKREEIRWLLGKTRVLVGTNASIWSLGGAQGQPFTLDTAQALVQSEVGSSWLSPLAVHDSVLYVRAKGFGVRDLSYDDNAGGFKGSDLSFLAQNFFEYPGHAIVDWAWQEDPWSIVWAVREDGALLSMTYYKDQEVFPWSWHDSDMEQGEFENVCTVPETTEDGVYFVVRRVINGQTKRYIERLTTRKVFLAKDGVFLDSSLTYSGSPVTTVTGLSHLNGKEVWALADGNVKGPYTVSGGSITLDNMEGGASLIHVGLRYYSEMEFLDVSSERREIRSKPRTVSRVFVEVEGSRGLWVGESLDDLVEWEQREVADNWASIPLESSTVDLTIKGTWNVGGRAALRQVDPLPLTVLSLTREIDLGD